AASVFRTGRTMRWVGPAGTGTSTAPGSVQPGPRPDRVLLEKSVDRLSVDLGFPGRLGDIPAVPLEQRLQVLPLERLDRLLLRHVERQVRGEHHRRSAGTAGARDLLGQVRCRDLLP